MIELPFLAQCRNTGNRNRFKTYALEAGFDPNALYRDLITVEFDIKPYAARLDNSNRFYLLERKLLTPHVPKIEARVVKDDEIKEYWWIVDFNAALDALKYGERKRASRILEFSL